MEFAKPNLLGSKKEFRNRFVHPITNGQYCNSTAGDVQLMKERAYVLHTFLASCVQRLDYTIIKPYLPVKHEYVLKIRLTNLQKNMYHYYASSKIK